jgi:hypothetical protein
VLRKKARSSAVNTLQSGDGLVAGVSADVDEAATGALPRAPGAEGGVG